MKLQWFYNQYDYEVDNSYNIERPYKAYEVLLKSLIDSDSDNLVNMK